MYVRNKNFFFLEISSFLTNFNISVKVCLVPQPMFCIEMKPDGEPNPEHRNRFPNLEYVTDLAQDQVNDVVGYESPWS